MRLLSGLDAGLVEHWVVRPQLCRNTTLNFDSLGRSAPRLFIAFIFS